jgi:small subunit ribosomal protein S17
MNKSEQTNIAKESQRKVVGVVVSDKMDKTIVVETVILKNHPKYKKQYKVSKRYKAHDEKNQFKEGDKVVIVETRPLSKDKKWIALEAK